MTTVVVDTAITEKELARLQFALQPAALMGWMKSTVEPYVQERAQKRFASEGDDVSGRWARLSDATIEIRTTGEPSYGSGPINVRTGQLEEYITENNGLYATTGGEAVMVYPGTAGDSDLQRKMIAAQQGLESTRLPNGGQGGRTPARPVLGLNETDLAAVLTQLELYIMAVQ